MTDDRFYELYSKLNPGQKEAVDSLEGPVVVLAGPGTGKTQVLTLRIAHILLKTDTSPGSILALTFTESGAHAMRARLFEIIGSPAYQVHIATFHGFCNSLIMHVPEAFPRIVGSTPLTEAEQLAIITQILSSSSYTLLTPYGDRFYYASSLVHAIREIKREGVDVPSFQALVAREAHEFSLRDDLFHTKGPHAGKMKGEYKKLEQTIQKNKELARLYAEYEEALARERRYDYNDMIMEVVRMLQEHHDMRAELQERYQYILADEHQDVNDAQNKLLELLTTYDTGDDPNLFIVGDDKQAIFRFQGASLHNFLSVLRRYPHAKVVLLEENYRSTQRVLDASHSLIEKNADLIPELRRRLRAVQSFEDVPIVVYAFGSPDIESYFVAEHIRHSLEEGISPHEIAVLYRDNRDADPLIAMFEKMQIPFVVESDQNVLHDSDIKKLLVLFRAIHDFGNDEFLIGVLHLDFLKVDPYDIYRLVHYARGHHIPLYSLVRSLAQYPDLVLTSSVTLGRIVHMLSDWHTVSHSLNLDFLFEEVVRDSGFLAHLLRAPNSSEKLEKLKALFSEAKSLISGPREYRLPDFLRHLALIETHHLSIVPQKTAITFRGVRLMTAHRSKGLEFAHVYIIGLAEGHWGNRTRHGHFKLPLHSDLEGAFPASTDADERRLFYVALTRAKQRLILTYSRHTSSGSETLPSVFLSDIDSSHLMQGDAAPYELQYGQAHEVLYAPRISPSLSVIDTAFIRELFLARGLSVTALNNYLECPWKFFYRNLLRIPEAKAVPQMYGIAIHAALAGYFKTYRDSSPDIQYLLQLFFSALRKEPLSSQESPDLQAKGERALRGYYDAYHTGWHRNTLTEFRIDGIMLTPEIRLTGQLDKIEILSGGNEVNVVDYKTAKPLSRNEIEGLTSQVRSRQATNDLLTIFPKGDYKRQLVFYKLLLDRHAHGTYRMVSGEIDFVEPNERGFYKKEAFEITDEETHALEEQVKVVAQEIFSAGFLEKRCESDECVYCELRTMMK